MLLALADNFRAKSSLGTCSKLSMIVLKDVKLLLNLLDPTDRNIAGSFETIGDFERMDALLQQFLGLLEDGTGEDDHTCRSVTNLIVLRCR